MNEELLINYASPTLANKKIANLFTFKNTENLNIEKMVAEWNDILNEKNVYVEILKKPSHLLKSIHIDLQNLNTY